MKSEGLEIEGGKAVRDADHGKDFVTELEVFPMAERGSKKDDLETEGGGRGILGPVQEGEPMMLGA